MSNVVTADGGRTTTLLDQKTNSLFGGGLLGGLDLTPYLSDYEMKKSLNTVPAYLPINTTSADRVELFEESGNNNAILILLAVVLGAIALIKTILD